MTRSSRPMTLGLIAAAMLVSLIVFLTTPGIPRDAIRPVEGDALAQWLADHPADWLAAARLSARALDRGTVARRELWRRSYAHALRLAPRRPNGPTAFVRGGLFHWYELSAADRSEVLRVAAPMLRDPQFFHQMHRPLWDLTRDLAYLRRNAPETENATSAMRDIAVTNGLFEDYRELRAVLTRQRMRKFEAERERFTAVELINFVPSPLTRDDEALVRRVLDQLQRRPLDASLAASVHGQGAALAEFAMRHALRPLDGLDALVETREIPPATRARLAEALGRHDDAKLIAGQNPTQRELRQWRGTCGTNEVCSAATATIPAAREITIGVAVVQSDEVPPYVEIYVDDARVAEGPVTDARQFKVPVRTAGDHRVEVRMANPWTRNRIQRRIRLS